MTRRPRTRQPLSIWIVAVVLPLIVTAVAVAVQLAWLPALPDPVAIHWDGDGGPDGFAPAWVAVALTAALGVGLTALFAVFLATARGASPTATHKLLATTSLGVSVLVGALVTASLGIQRGLADARDAGGLDGWLALGFGVAVVVGVGAWVLLTRAVSPASDAVTARPLRLDPGERSVWIATTRLSTGAAVAIVAAIGFAIAACVFAIAVTDGAVWPIAGVPILLLAMCAVGLVWRVRIDPTGLTVRSQPFGWPRNRIPVADIAEVETSQVDPLAEFGGYGWRWAPGRSFGVVTRAGEAIEVTRRDGRRFTLTVDDAATGAALLAAYAEVEASAG